MTDHLADIKTYTANVNEAAVAAIVKYCGIALRSAKRGHSPQQTRQHPQHPHACTSAPGWWIYLVVMASAAQ